jgi:hypothetical protein
MVIFRKVLLLSTLVFSVLTNPKAQTPENYPANYASAPRFRALIYFNDRTEDAHVIFAHQTIAYLQKLTGHKWVVGTDEKGDPFKK